MRIFTIVALAVAIGLGTALSPFASSSPDGLQRVAERKAFVDGGRLASVQEKAPVPGYAFPGIEDARLATGLAGFTGTLGVFALGYGIAAVARRRPTGAQPA
jgi:hypothetical protein